MAGSGLYRVVVDPRSKDGLELRGGNLEAFRCKDQQYVVSGPGDTGKTVGCCAKLHLTCLKYPGSQHAMMRKTFASIAGSVGQTFARTVRGAPVTVLGGDKPTKYQYHNGSTVWVGGLDNPERALSSERDTIYVNQTEELTKDDWETISSRCSGRGAVVRWPQLYGDCNPAGSKHWIKEKAKAGVLKLINAGHRDNPTLYRADGTYVEDGERVGDTLVVRGGRSRLAVLASLTGVRRKRLFEGVWATAEGAVYDNFDATVNVLARDPAEVKRWFLAMDEGFTNPAVILDVGEDSDGRWHVFREFYQTGQLQETVVKQACRWHQERRRELVAVDESAAGLIADLQSLGLPARGGKGRVVDGINRLQNRLAPAADGRPRLTFDPSCVNCVNEFESYVWQKDKPKDTPVKEFDHTSDALRYLGDALNEPDGSFLSAAGIRAGGGEADTTFHPDRLELDQLDI